MRRDGRYVWPMKGLYYELTNHKPRVNLWAKQKQGVTLDSQVITRPEHDSAETPWDDKTHRVMKRVSFLMKTILSENMH